MMTNREKLAFRILASLYPDRRPSEIRKIIDEALAKEENNDDIELWAVLTKEKTNKEEPVKEKIIEHHYHDYWYHPYTYLTSPNFPIDNTPIITCDGTNISNTITDLNKITVDSNKTT